MRRKRQENNLVFNDPFKNPQTSLHKLHGERKHGGNTTEKPNNINRFKDGHKMEVRKRVKPPPKAVKRWSDVVIEFKEVEKKRERRELALLNGEILEEDEDPYNPLDYAPMYSSFTHDLTFVEPVYGVIKSAKDEDEWPDIMLKPLHCSASGRKLTISTTQPGIQFYTGNHLSGNFNQNQGLCLETQHFPDSPNNDKFPTTKLMAKGKYYSETTYIFDVI